MLKSRSQIAEVIRRYVEHLRKLGVEVERVFLYGSYLKGTANEWSDLDVVVVSPTWKDKSVWDRADVTGRARALVFEETGMAVEAIPKTPEELAALHPASFLADVLKDAELVYQRTPAAA